MDTTLLKFSEILRFFRLFVSTDPNPFIKSVRHVESGDSIFFGKRIGLRVANPVPNRNRFETGPGVGESNGLVIIDFTFKDKRRIMT